MLLAACSAKQIGDQCMLYRQSQAPGPAGEGDRFTLLEWVTQNMSDEGAGYFAAAQRTDHSREELKEQVEELREEWDLSDEEMEQLLAEA